MANVFFRLCILLGFTVLVGCSSNSTIDPPPDAANNSKVITGVIAGGVAGAAVGAMSTGVTIPAAAAIGGITGGALAMSLTTKDTPEQTLEKKLRGDHVQIIRVGEDYMLVLPGEDYFYTDSAHFNEKMYPAMADIAQYINQFDIETIKVAGYTGNEGNECRHLAISKAMAQTVLTELWYNGVRPSYMYSIGYGSQYPIADNTTKSGQNTNHRVQITFRRLTPQS